MELEHDYLGLLFLSDNGLKLHRHWKYIGEIKLNLFVSYLKYNCIYKEGLFKDSSFVEKINYNF